jgi:hypothetical protein
MKQRCGVAQLQIEQKVTGHHVHAPLRIAAKIADR